VIPKIGEVYKFLPGTERETKLWGVRQREQGYEARVILVASALVKRISGGSRTNQRNREFTYPTPGVIYTTAQDAHAVSLIWAIASSQEFTLVFQAIDRYYMVREVGAAPTSIELRMPGSKTTQKESKNVKFPYLCLINFQLYSLR
jgi:hypothetical protein